MMKTSTRQFFCTITVPLLIPLVLAIPQQKPDSKQVQAGDHSDIVAPHGLSSPIFESTKPLKELNTFVEDIPISLVFYPFSNIFLSARNEEILDHHSVGVAEDANCLFEGFEKLAPYTSLLTLDFCEAVKTVTGQLHLNGSQYLIEGYPTQPIPVNKEDGQYELTFHKMSPSNRRKRQSTSWLDVPSIKPLKQQDYFRLLSQVSDTFILNRKTISLTIYVDKDFNSLFPTESSLRKYLFSLISQVDQVTFNNLYRTHVVLNQVNIWAINLIDISADIQKNLKNFLMHLDTLPQMPDSTVTILITGNKKVVPNENAANHRSICNPKKAAAVLRIEPDKATDKYETPNTISLVLGHILGMTHDGSSACNCSEGCIMSKFSPYVHSKYSICSRNEFLQLMFSGRGHCIFGLPKTTYNDQQLKICGNGRIEGDEECDCGSPLECAFTGHANCCQECKLNAFSQCGSGECCDSQCRLKANGTICRKKMGDCDVSERCSGLSAHCPDNLFKINASPCNDDSDFCYNGECMTRDHQCQLLYGVQSKSGKGLCYENLNSAGSEYGNCGDLGGGKFRPCYKQNVYCGMLQCNGSLSTSVKIERVRRFRFNAFNTQSNEVQSISDKCSGASVVLDDGTDVGYVRPGTKCGQNKVCSINNQCLDIRTDSRYFICPGHDKVKGHFCSNHGYCSNQRLCVCDYGWMGSDCSIPDKDLIKENQIPKDDPSTPGEKPYDPIYPAGNDNFLDLDNSRNNPGNKPSPFEYDKNNIDGLNSNKNTFSPVNPYPDWQQQGSKEKERTTGSTDPFVLSNALFLAIIIKLTNFHETLIQIAECSQF